MSQNVYDDIQIMNDYNNSYSLLTKKMHNEFQEQVPQLSMIINRFNDLPSVSLLRGSRDYSTFLFRMWDPALNDRPNWMPNNRRPSGSTANDPLIRDNIARNILQPWNANIVLADMLRFRTTFRNASGYILSCHLDTFPESIAFSNVSLRVRMQGRWAGSGSNGSTIVTNNASHIDWSRGFNTTHTISRPIINGESFQIDNQCLFGSGASSPTYWISFILNNEVFLYEIIVRTGSSGTTITDVSENGVHCTVIVRRLI